MADPKKLRADANALATELLARLQADEVHSLEVKRGSLRVRVSKDGPPVGTPAAAPAASAHAPSPITVSVAEAPAKSEHPTVNAPLTGIFYRSPSPQAPPFIQVGDRVEQGSVIALIEAMKLFNEIRSTAGGKVRRILVENGQLVRAHQPLIELE